MLGVTSASHGHRSCHGYDRYPTNLADYNCFTTNGEELSNRLSSLSADLFIQSSDSINVDIFDIDGLLSHRWNLNMERDRFLTTQTGSKSSGPYHFSETRKFEDYLDNVAKSPKVRVMYGEAESMNMLRYSSLTP